MNKNSHKILAFNFFFVLLVFDISCTDHRETVEHK